MAYIVHLATLFGISLIVAQGFNITFGLSRLLNLAHIAAYALGAYTAALLSTRAGLDNLFAILPAALVSGILLGYLTAFVAARLSSDFLAIGTLAFAALVSALLVNCRSITGGVLGVPGIPRPTGVWLDTNEGVHFMLVVLLVALVIQCVLWLVFSGPFARTLRAMAESPESCLIIGHNIFRARLMSLVVGSGLAAIAGALFAFFLNYIDPSSFSLAEMMSVLTIVIIGRPGSLWGIVGATAILTLLPEALRFVEMPSSILGPMRQLIFALMLWGLILLRRESLFPKERRV